jgi:hypothetical protein
MADTRPIWEGIVGSTPWRVVIEPIGNNMNRGNLTIRDSKENVHYQREVAVTRREPLGGTPANMAEWQKVITTWIHNND